MTFWITNLAERRKCQLTQEEFLDTRLKNECQSQCPEVLQQYFFNLRNLNRLFSVKLYSASFFHYPSMISKHMEITENLQTCLLQRQDLSNTQLCKQLFMTNEKIKEEIRKISGV